MSAQIKLTHNKHALVDDDDYEWLKQWKWHCSVYGYAVVSDGTAQFMHRMVIKAPRGIKVDHINGNRLDNRKENLRIVSDSQNRMNSRKRCKWPRKLTSLYKGVGWHDSVQLWRARITVQQKQMYIGYFDSELAAAMAYDIAAKDLYGEYARLNFPNAIHG